MYLQSCYYQILPSIPVKQSRQRYQRYYKDLHQRYALPLDESSILKGEYSPESMCYQALNHYADLLEEIDLLVIACWSHEFDSDYASLGAHLLHHYHLKASVFDITDKASSSTFIALHIIKALQDTQKTKKTLLLAYDHIYTPFSKKMTLPSHNAVSALLLSNEPCQGVKIIAIEWQTQIAANIQDLISASLEKFTINIQDCHIHIRSKEKGVSSLLHDIKNIMSKHHDKIYQIIIDQDIESNETGIIILDVSQIC